MNRLLISAAHKSSGKTTLSIGLCAALRARRLVVQPFKKGPDFIDPMWLSLAAGRDCHNLDFYLMGHDEIRRTFAERSRGADVAIIEGNKGLYDGLSLDGSNSNAALAALLNTPVVLVIDARGMTRGIAPLILGYQAFDRDVKIAGVILNQLGGSRHEAKLRAVIEHYTNVRVLGAVHYDERLGIVERHLGLVPSNEAAGARSRIDAIGEQVANSVNLDYLMAVAAQAPALPAVTPIPAPPRLKGEGNSIRLGVARDAAFTFYYPGDLEALRAAGAELVYIDTLKDPALPPVDALLIGGGFPEVFMQQLEANASLRRDIHQAIEGGMPAYAECGGLMYLSRSLSWDGKRCEMVGVIPGDTVMHKRPMGRGYVLLRNTGKGLWPQPPNAPAEVRAHEFHYSSLENLSPGLEYAYEVLRGTGIDGKHDGIVYKNLLGCYTHLRDLEDNHWAERFVNFVRAQRLGASPRQAARSK
ncbi:MAG TPA: cobyrinate a,c-diamide synthase [Candidatus Methylomirabilis sp.]|nr:cobyrinate a,c-diamide synthase [Candidatus Methylomirabilis sp.]